MKQANHLIKSHQ